MSRHRLCAVLAAGTVTLEIEPAREWPEPRVPADLRNALAADLQVRTPVHPDRGME